VERDLSQYETRLVLKKDLERDLSQFQTTYVLERDCSSIELQRGYSVGMQRDILLNTCEKTHFSESINRYPPAAT